MNRKTLAPWLASALLVVGCTSDKKKSSKDDKKSAEKTAEKSTSTESDAPGLQRRSALGADTAKADELWALAPQTTAMGMVAVPGMGKRMHEALLQVVKTAEAQPFGKTLVAGLRADAIEEEGFDPFDPQSLAKTGLDLSKGAAMFMIGKDDGVAIVPVGDRAAFRTFTEAKVETMDGLEVDKIGDDTLCLQKEYYVCGDSLENIKSIGEKVDGPLAKRVAGLPEELRGDAEMVIDVAAMQKLDGEEFEHEFYDSFKDPQLGVLSLRFDNGALRARGWYQVKPVGIASDATSVSGSLAAAAASQHPTGVFSLRLPHSLMTMNLPPSDSEALPGSGIMVKKDIFGNLTGEILAFGPSSSEMWGTFAVGIKDGAPFKKLLNVGCGMAGGMVPGIESKPGDGRCDMTVDFSKMPLPDPTVADMIKEPISIVAEVKSDQLAITIGKVAPINEGHTPSALGQDLLKNHWNFGMWAEGISIVNGADIPWNEMSMLPPDVVNGIKLGAWMLSQIYEVGMAGAVRDDGIHAVLEIATYAGDPAPAYQAYQAAVLKVLESGNADAEFAALGKKHPGTMASSQGHGPTSGSIIVAGFTGLIAAVAIPAFVKYVERAKEVEGAVAPK